MTKAKFVLGQVVATPGALEVIRESGQTPGFFLMRHAAGDWGEVNAEDWSLNDQMARQFLADNHNDLVSLAQILGHESLNTTSRYTKRTTEQLAEAAERLSF